MARLGMLYALEEEAVQHLCKVASEERDDYIFGSNRRCIIW